MMNSKLESIESRENYLFSLLFIISLNKLTKSETVP